MDLNRKEELLMVALELLESGKQPVALSGITIDENGKKDFYSITKWQNRETPFTKEEVIKDFNDSRTENIGVRTGKVSDLDGIDVDEGADKEFVEKHLKPIQERTVIVKTQSGGKHYWIKHPGFFVKTSAGELAQGIDTRGDGG